MAAVHAFVGLWMQARDRSRFNPFHGADQHDLKQVDDLTPLESALLLSCGLLWTLTYLLVILTAYRTRTPAMPYFALALNIAWEFLFAFVTPYPMPWRLIDVLWFVLDCVILLQTLAYFPYDVAPLHLSDTLFLLGTAVTLLTSFSLQWSWTVTLDDSYGTYSSFVLNLFMSVSFVAMFLTRQPRGAGQSVWIAASKLTGTACSSVAFYLLATRPNALLNVLFVAVFAWDTLYVGLLVQHALQRNRSEALEEDIPMPWLRDDGSMGAMVSHAALTQPLAPPHGWEQHTYRY